TLPMVGASGAIAGVLAAYGSLYPMSPVTILNPVPLLWIFFGLFFELPAWVVILEFFIFNAWRGLGSLGGAGGAGIAFFAHLGGFVTGLVLVRVFATTGRGSSGGPARRFRAADDAPSAGARRGPWAW
ncbi:MAG TPA: rhomboid family intramembrane serine protease, partial [Byssovorax sp.]